MILSKAAGALYHEWKKMEKVIIEIQYLNVKSWMRWTLAENRWCQEDAKRKKRSGNNLKSASPKDLKTAECGKNTTAGSLCAVKLLKFYLLWFSGSIAYF